MITAAQLKVALSAEGGPQTVAQIRGVGDAVEQTGQQSQRGLSGITKAALGFGVVGGVLTAKLTRPLVDVGLSIVNMASDTNEALSAVSTVYGSAAQTVIASSQNAATAVGLSQEQYLSATTNLAAYGNMMGLTQAQTATFADQTVSAAADLASFYNTSPEDAMGAIQGGLRGEGEALERYGIIMNQATVEQYALTNGIWDGNGAMTTQQLETARSGFIMDQLTSSTGSANAAMGDFDRTSTGLANQQRILKAEVKNLGAQFGQVLLPIALKAVGVFQKVIGVLQDMSPHAKAVVVVVGAIAAAIGPALIGIGSLLPALVNGFRVFRLALLAVSGPVGLIVVGLTLLGIAYKKNFLGFGDAVRSLGSRLKDLLSPITDVFNRFRSVFDALRGGQTELRTTTDAFGNAVQVAVRLGDGLGVVESALGAFSAALRAIGGDNAPAFLVKLADIVDQIIPKWRELTGWFQFFNSYTDPVNAALSALSLTFPKLADAIAPVQSAVNRLKDAFAEDGLMGVMRAVPGLLADTVAALGGVALDLGGWVLNVGIPAVGGWLLGGLTAVSAWIFDGLGVPAGVALDFVGWVLTVAAPAVGGWLTGGANAVLDWIKSKIGIGSVAASPDGIPTGGGGTEITWKSWLLSVAAPAVGGWLAGGVGAVVDWIKGKLGIGSVAASPDGIPTGGGGTTIGWGSWVLDVALPKVGGWLATAYTGVFDLVKAFLPAAGTKLGDLASWGLDVALPKVGGWLATAYSGIFDLITAFLPAAGTKLGDLASWGLDVALPTIGGWLATAYESVASLVQGFLPQGIALGSIANWIMDVALPVIGGWLATAYSTVKDLVQGFLPATGATLGTLADWWLDVGVPNIRAAETFLVDLKDQVLATIKDAFDNISSDDVMKAMFGFGQSIDAAFRDAMGGNSLNLKGGKGNSGLTAIALSALKAVGAVIGPLFAGLIFGDYTESWATFKQDFNKKMGELISGVIEKINLLRDALGDGVFDFLFGDGASAALDRGQVVADRLQGISEQLRASMTVVTDGVSSVAESLANGSLFPAPPPPPPYVSPTGPDPRAGQYPDPGAAANDPSNPNDDGVWRGTKFAGNQTTGLFDGFIQQAKDARTAFTEVMTGIATDSDTGKSSVVAALTGMATDGLPQVTALSVGSVGQFLAMQLGTNAQAAAMQGGVSAALAGMQVSASGSAGLTNDDVSTKLGSMKTTGSGHANALSAQTLLAFNNLKLGAIVAASTTSSEVVSKLGTMAVGGGQKATELMNAVKGGIANSGAANTAYSVGYNIGSSLSGGTGRVAAQHPAGRRRHDRSGRWGHAQEGADRLAVQGVPSHGRLSRRGVRSGR